MTTLIGQDRSPFKTAAYQYIRSTDNLPSTDEAAAQDNPLCKVKLFGGGSWTWYVAGYDPETGLAFGVVDGFEKEIGDFDLNELKAVRTRPFGLPIERDLWWTSKTAEELLRE